MWCTYTRSGAAERSFVQCAVQREWEGEVQLHQRGIASRHCLDGEAFVWLCQGFFNPQHHQWAGHSYRGVPPLQHKSETTPWVEQMLSGRPGEEKGQIWGLPWLPECLGGHCWAFKGLPTEGSWKGGTERFFAKSLIWIQIDKWPILNLLDQVHFSVHMTTLWLFGLLWEDEGKELSLYWIKSDDQKRRWLLPTISALCHSLTCKKIPLRCCSAALDIERAAVPCNLTILDKYWIWLTSKVWTFSSVLPVATSGNFQLGPSEDYWKMFSSQSLSQLTLLWSRAGGAAAFIKEKDEAGAARNLIFSKQPPSGTKPPNQLFSSISSIWTQVG